MYKYSSQIKSGGMLCVRCGDFREESGEISRGEDGGKGKI